MLCILSVFIPTFILNEPVRSLFMPLTLAVGFSMIASYMLSSTLVPVLSVWLVRHKEEHSAEGGLFGKLLVVYNRIVAVVIRLRWIAVPGYLAACGLLFWRVGTRVGRELFPQVDAGQFVIRFRALPGSEYELTRKLAVKMLEVIDQESQHKVAISMGYVGMAATNTATNNMLLFMRGPDDGQMRVRLQEGSGVHLADLRDRLRKTLPEQLIPWTKQELERNGLPADEAQSLAKKISFGFEPGDIVSEVMSFGSPTPVEVMVVGPDLEAVASMRSSAGRNEEDLLPPRCATFPTARLPHRTRGDRSREIGLKRRHRQGHYQALLVGTSSSRYVAKNYWRIRAPGSIIRCRSRSPFSA